METGNLRLLVIEDNADQRELICEALEEHFGRGTAIGAENRAAALGLDLGRFDLVLCDYNLPDAAGMELLEDLQRRCSAPIIMVTGENVGGIAADAIRRGATDYVVKTGDYLFTLALVVEKNLTSAKMKRDNESLNRKLALTLEELQRKNAQLETSLRRLEEVAATDPLTGLYNRRHFGRVLDPLFAAAQRYGQDLSCAMIDLDGYKQINDTLGHPIGDQLLVLAGRVISANMRKMDVAARYGGDEFILLLSHANADEAMRVAERIGMEFSADSARVLNRDRGVTMSIGISSLSRGRPVQSDQLVAMADGALYRAKQAGRNRVIHAGGGATDSSVPHTVADLSLVGEVA